MKINNSKHIDWEIISETLEGSSSGTDKRKLDAWLANEDNQKYFDEIKKVWGKTGNISYCYDEETNKAWQKTSKILFKTSINKTRTIVLKVAQIAALLTIIFFAAKYLFYAEKIDLVTQDKILNEYVLPDKSSISVNKHSQLSYVKEFKGSQRNVWLKGEAFFDVKKNPDKPFIIETQKGIFKVLGTSFNISCYEKNTDVTLSVKTGKVMFTTPNKNTITVIKNESITYNTKTNKIIKSKKLNPNVIAWKTKQLFFKNTSMYDVIKTLENVYDVNINIVDDHINQLKLSANFDHQSLDKVLKVIALTFDLKTDRTKDSIKLYYNE